VLIFQAVLEKFKVLKIIGAAASDSTFVAIEKFSSYDI
jgi:hypothetical protein